MSLWLKGASCCDTAVSRTFRGVGLEEPWTYFLKDESRRSFAAHLANPLGKARCRLGKFRAELQCGRSVLILRHKKKGFFVLISRDSGLGHCCFIGKDGSRIVTSPKRAESQRETSLSRRNPLHPGPWPVALEVDLKWRHFFSRFLDGRESTLCSP